MVCTSVLGGEEAEDDVDRRVVERLELDRAGEAEQERLQLIEADELAVRDRDPAADTGRAEPFALIERVEDLALRKPRLASGDLAHLLERVLLRVRVEAVHHRTGGEYVGDVH